MSAPPLALRPAVDARPPALSWSWRPASCPTRPRPISRRCSSSSSRIRSGRRRRHRPRALVSVDTVPAGIDPVLGRELEEQARTWAPWFAQLLVEALDGRRPLEALGHWLDEWVLAEVSRRVRVQRRARRARPPAVPSRPAGSSRCERSSATRRCWRSPRTCDGVAARHAWAFQLRRVGDRWRCTALELRDRLASATCDLAAQQHPGPADLERDVLTVGVHEAQRLGVTRPAPGAADLATVAEDDDLALDRPWRTSPSVRR